MKLFGKGGKLNVIDIIVILILIAALAFAAYKLLGPDTEALDANGSLSSPNIRFQVLCEDIPAELADSIVSSLSSEATVIDGVVAPTNRMYNSNKLVDAQITAWDIQADGEGRADLYLTVEAAATVTGGAYSIVTQEVRLAKEYIVKTVDVEITGVIFSMEKLG